MLLVGTTDIRYEGDPAAVTIEPYEVEYLLEGRQPAIERELALEKGRVLLAQGDPRTFRTIRKTR